MAGVAPPRGSVRRSQAPQQPAPRFRTGIDVVEVAVLVRDREGKPVTDLTRDEITVLENGAPQTLVAFEKVSFPVRRGRHAAARGAGPAGRRQQRVARPGTRLRPRARQPSRRRDSRRVVKALARQFIENNVGPDDYVGVFSPGALPSATQDFTTDKARLLAAIDQFTGMKMMSAVVEVDREKQAAAGMRGAIPMHAGKDPSDSERTDRALALTGTLEALASHLERIPGRRKTLLLFSEGVDYDQADVLGTGAAKCQRRHARDGPGDRRADADERRAVRGRSQGTQLGGADLLETPVTGPARHRRVLRPHSCGRAERFDPDTPLAVGVDRRFRGGEPQRLHRRLPAHRRREQLGTTSSGIPRQRAAKPGEFRSIAVKVSRPGVSISARNGYTGRVEPAVRRTASDVPVAEPSSGFPMPSRAGAAARRSRSPCPRQRTARTRGLASPLQALLASPLPQPGLPIRVQAVTLRGDGRKSDVRLVVEVLGRALQFDERGGRFNERLELALLTVNDSGRASNGTSIDIDLRLTPDDLARVRGTGVRWLSALELPPGRHQLRVAGRAAGTGVSGMITHDVIVPAPRRNGVEMSGITLTSAPSVLMITKGKPWLDQALPTPPTAARTFVAGDEVVAAVEVYRQGSAAAGATLIARIDRRDGSPTGFNERRAVQANGPNSEAVGLTISTAKLPVGSLRAPRDAGSARKRAPPAGGAVRRRRTVS